MSILDVKTLQSPTNFDLTLDAQGSGKDIIFKSDGTQVASISDAGLLTATTIDATVLTGALPAISGASLTGLTSAQMPSGTIIQTVVAESETTATTTSTSWTDSGLSATITPTSSSNKILVHFDNSVYQGAANYHTTVTVFRGSVASGVELGASSTWGFGSIYTSSGGHMSNMSYTYLDNPNTTSATTYTFAFRTNNSSGSASVQMNSNKGNLTLQEVVV